MAKKISSEKMKIFTRTNATTVKKTVALYKIEVKRELPSFIKAFTAIPFAEFLFAVLLPLLTSLLIQLLITNPQDTKTIALYIGGMVVAVMAGIFTNLYGFNHLFYHEERVITRLLKKAADGLLQHSFEFFSKQKVGSLAGDINNFSRSYMQIMDVLAMQASRIAVDMVASLIIIAFLSPLLLVPIIAMIVVAFFQTIVSANQRATYRNERKELQSKLLGSIADAFGNHTLVRMFARRHYEVERLVTERRRIQNVTINEIDILQLHAKYRMMFLYSFQVIIISLSAFFVSNNMMTIAAVVFIVTYLGRFTGSIFSINGIIRNIEQAFLDAAKVTEYLSIAKDVMDAPRASPIVVTTGFIKFNHVTFAYQDARDVAVFSDLSLTIPAGQRVGLVGRSGGGKTTLTSLLLRYMDIQNGKIAIDDQDISKVTQDSLREVIAYVPQDPYLFHRSLRENIAYGRIGATDQDIINAAKNAHAFEFIEKLPMGIDTIVGERGVKLSGGQRQRIAIARAFLKNAPILVLDEATSALDSESEHLIQQSLEKLMQGRTSIIVAHRLSTIARLDRILVIEDGNVIEDGSHDELLQSNGLYSKLWKRQSGGFIEGE